ncbi:SDR family NAD(P)-dependent oxidoreductase [Polyangium mundeleinium]|uniref:SDR family NAD(P)-dependent oxidoreductase n=1 Tax=Polyangium mundeleinium TaxID=2995306 RepID=A0ABT5EJN2_9BACT|nr:SDR family oxidoreductase [Polyangium mundeleinium]MDC0742033.1 SDR family NAD(P)-dependent oxidoreductase [Polyangium mundeleinium]
MKGQAIAVVTGGSAGIGRAVLERFVRAGARGVNLARRPSGLPGVLDLSVDLADPAWENDLPPRLLPLLDGAEPICLVHNAAVLREDTATNLTAAALRSVLELNIVAPAALNRLLDARLVPGSSIVYIGSTLSEIGVPGKASYVTSKHAILGLMRATCQDLAGRGVTTVAVCPGFADTEMLRAHLGHDAARLDVVRERSTFGRLIDPEEIADVVAFCAQTPVLHGAVIHANLGQRTS